MKNILEIKYRIWHKIKTIMYPVTCIWWNDNGNIEAIEVPNPDNKNESIIFDRDDEDFKNIIIMKFTGIWDKKQNEIYEDDIIEWEVTKNSKWLYNVYFDYEFGRWLANPISSTPRQAESDMIWKKSRVIGNIHENANIYVANKL
jgi:uncharacterized phage protein (TIGR01671 family)